MSERTRTYIRVADETTHTAHVRIGDDGKARVPEDQLHHVLLEAGYTELTETTT